MDVEEAREVCKGLEEVALQPLCRPLWVIGVKVCMYVRWNCKHRTEYLLFSKISTGQCVRLQNLRVFCLVGRYIFKNLKMSKKANNPLLLLLAKQYKKGTSIDLTLLILFSGELLSFPV